MRILQTKQTTHELQHTPNKATKQNNSQVGHIQLHPRSRKLGVSSCRSDRELARARRRQPQRANTRSVQSGSWSIRTRSRADRSRGRPTLKRSTEASDSPQLGSRSSRLSQRSISTWRSSRGSQGLDRMDTSAHKKHAYPTEINNTQNTTQHNARHVCPIADG